MTIKPSQPRLAELQLEIINTLGIISYSRDSHYTTDRGTQDTGQVSVSVCLCLKSYQELALLNEDLSDNYWWRQETDRQPSDRFI